MGRVSLGSVLVDRGRVVRRTATGQRVEGTVVRSDVSGEWFRCRLDLPGQQESRDDHRSRRASSPTLIAFRSDVTGQPVAITGDDRIEVVSRELGTLVLEVRGAPMPLRKRRRVIGWEVQVQEVEP